MRPLRRDHDQGASPIRDAHEDIHAELGDRYALEDVLGRGGMGTVYLARDLKHDRRVAIKTIHPELAAGVGARRFEREIRITAHLQHPHILPLLDSGVAGDTLFYVMPYIEGDSLRARLDTSGPLSAEEVVRVGNDVLEALDYAHRRDVVHRDIKPDNILLGERHALIADFGIAKALTPTGEESITGTGWRVGSPAYMAPEQAAGEAGPQSDLYALGAVLYEASTGTRWPQTADLDAADWSGVPASLRGTIRRSLAWLPADRWPDAASFRRALRGGRARSRARGFGAAALLAAVGVGVGSWWVARTLGGDASSGSEAISRSIAVLPLENLNGDEETEYFSDGVTEDIIAQLSRIGELDVISRNSSMQYKGTAKSVADIGRELHVGAVLDGSVRRDGDRVRIVSQLIDTRTDATLWGETYDRELTDVFAIQADVAQRIAGALRATITPTERSMIERRPTQDVEAHTLYLRGRYLWNRRTRAGLEGAVDYFRRAAERDPTYAPAFAGLADAYLLLGSYQYMPEADAIRETRAAVERALELDDRLAEAYATLGQVRRSERDWVGEEQAYLRSIELNPSYAVAHQWYATLLAALGRHEEALREVRLAESLDPLSQAISVTAGIVLFIERDFEGAIRQLERTLELAPDYFSAYVYLMLAYGETGRYEEAQRAYDRLVELRPDIPQWGFFLATVHARAGRPELARGMIADLTGDRDDRILRAWVHADLGEVDAAFDLLRQELDDDSRSMFVFFRALLFYMEEGMWFDGLRSDPRFAALIEREHLP